jgi:hypothetical protein
MQVQFTPDELQILTDALVRHNRDLIHEIARTDHREFKQMLQKKLDLLTGLQDQLLRGELQFSENERAVLNEVLDHSESALYFEIARTDDRGFKQLLKKNLECLELVHFKITEARAAA